VRASTNNVVDSIVKRKSIAMPGESSMLSPVVVEEAHAFVNTELGRAAVPGERLDFIGSSAAVKDLFALPYTVMDRSVAVAVHNMGGTLLIDAADPSRAHVASTSLPIETSDVVKAKKVANVISMGKEEENALALVHSMIQAEPSNVIKVKNASASASNRIDNPSSVPDDVVAQYIPPSLHPREYLSWKFQDLNLLIASDAVIYRAHPGEKEDGESSTALVVRVEEAQHLRNLLQVKTFQQQQLQAPRSYAQVVARPALTTSDTVEAIMPSFENLDSVTSPPHDSETFLPLVPSSPPLTLSHRMDPPNRPVVESTTASTRCTPLNPVSTVLDTYLDNIMANVPQLALCLREKGFIQSVKLLNTDEIPSRLIHSSTLDTSVPFETIQGGPDPADEVFSPQIMEMNAQALLRFLKNNCTKDNATYILRRDVGRTNVQLYDISSISAQRQQKWIWSLAMISYRFAHRLQHLSTDDPTLRRTFRARQRSLLHNTLDLLETLVDMNGHKHESLMAAISENLADTFLTELRAGAEGDHVPEVQSTPAADPITPPPQAVSSHQPYGSISVDALGKAQDHLVYGIKVLNAVLEQNLRSSSQQKRTEHPERGFSDASDSEEDDDSVPTDERLDPVVMQLFGMHLKLVNVSLRLAEIHLKNYWSSSAMQNLRTAAQRIADSFCFAQLVDHNQGTDTQKWLPRIELQYAWLWEQCGHFARSFAADGQWRDRGHASGDDVVSVLQDVDTAFVDRAELNRDGPLQLSRFAKPPDALTVKSNGATGFQSLSGLLDSIGPSVVAAVTSEMKQVSLDAAMKRLENQKVLQRDERRVLVAAALAYSRVVYVFDNCVLYSSVEEALVTLVRQRLGDACNEIGKVMLNEIRNLLLQRSSEEEELTAWTAEALCSSAEFWFREGLRSFEQSIDVRNVALLRCNLCQCYKLRANAIFARQPIPDHAETCLQEATNQLQAAHSALEIRDTDPVTWDMVSGELAATLLVLGVRRRQSLIGSGNRILILQTLRLSPGKVRSVVDPMERALGVYEEMGNYGQAAAVHYQLAQFYSKIWTCQRDEAKTREKLAAALHHYHAAHNYYAKTVRGNEATFCLLCLDLASLFASVSGEGGLSKALLCCLDTSASLAPDSISSALADLVRRQEWLTTMDTLAASVDERIFQLLKRLVKVDTTDKYKNLYRAALGAKMASKSIAIDNPTGDESLDAVVKRLEMVRHVLEGIKQQNP
jgi:tetratricopeptide (TPR) repeat protein